MLAVCEIFSKAAEFVWEHGGDVVVNIVSDFAFILVVGFGGWLWFRFTKIRDLREFFGTSAMTPMTVWLSDVPAHRLGKTPDNINRSDYGVNVSVLESQSAQCISDQFRFLIPGTGDLPEFLQRILLDVRQVDTRSAGRERGWLGFTRGTNITIGGPPFNEASRRFEQVCGLKIGFGDVRDVQEISVLDRTFRRSSQENRMLGFVARVQHNQNTLFYTAGFDDFCSSGAAHFLARKWKDLHAKYGTRPFAIVVDFWGVHDLRLDDPKIVFERELS